MNVLLEFDKRTADTTSFQQGDLAMRSYIGVCLLAVFSACGSDQPSSPIDGSELTLSELGDTSSLSGAELVNAGILTLERLRDIHKVTRGLAVSLNDDALRMSIRDEMRRSPFNEHKTTFENVLADLTLTPRIASFARLPETRVQDLLSTLSKFDFYLPWEEHRQTWKATDDILVGIVFDVNDPIFTAYDLAGKSMTIDARQEMTRPIIVLHPAERKTRRDNADLTMGPAEVVEQSGESTDHSRSLGTSEMCSDPEFCGGSGYQIDFRLKEFELYYEGDAIGQGEMEFNFRYWENGQVTRENTLYYGSGFNCCSPHVDYFPDDVFWSGPTPLDLNHFVEMDIREEDPGWPYGDEEWIDDQIISSSSQLGVDLLLEGTCHYFQDDDHPFIQGEGSGGPCHHKFFGTFDTPILEVQVKQEVRN